MRTLTGTERTDVSASAGHWVFAYLEVTDDAGTFVNLGALSVGTLQLDFLNTATISDNIDANTISFSATMKREIGSASLSPFRTDSPVNESGATPGTYSPRTDLHRQWRVMCAVVPRGTTPALPSGYTELAAGIVDKITVDGLQDTITVEGRGLEADLLDAFVVDDHVYSGAMEDVIQDALDDQMGVGVVSLYTPVSPSFQVDDTIGDINLMPALSDIAALTGWSLRYRYDASDVNRFTLFEPPRTNTTPDWTIADTEYEDLSVSIDLSNVRNYIKVNYVDAVSGLVTVIAPGPESGFVSCTSQAATFSVDQSAVLADGAIIVVNDVGYVVSNFDGTTGCTLVGAPDFMSQAFYTSASITKYGLRTMVIDLSSGSQITDATAAGDLADAVLADLQDPLLVQSLKAPGLWFVQLHDYVQTSANGVHYNDDQFGGVTSYSHEFADGMLTTTVGLAGAPKGRYTTWKRIGSGAAASPVLPELAYVSAEFYDTGSYIGVSPFGAFIYSAYAGTGCVTIRVQHGTDPTFTTNTTTADFAGSPALDGFSLTSSADRDKTYYFRFTPYSGALVGGAVSGLAGDPIDRQVYVPPVPTNSSSVTFSRSAAGELTATVDSTGLAAPIGAALNTLSVPLNLVTVPEDDQWLALSTIPVATTEVGSEYRQQYYAVGAGAVRIGANIKTLTGTPTIGGVYSLDGFGSTAALQSFTPISTGVQYSNWTAMPAAAQADIGVSWTVANGADTAALDLYRVWLEFRAGTYTAGAQSGTVRAAGAASVSAAVTRVGSIYDDEFTYTAAIDTAGTRAAGAVPWTLVNSTSGTYNASGGLLSIVAPATTPGTIDLKWATMPLPAGDSRWQAQITMVGAQANYRLAGLGLRDSVGGGVSVIDFAYSTSFGPYVVMNYAGGSVGNWAGQLASTSIPGTTSIILELERTGGGTSSVYRYSLDGGANFITLRTGDLMASPDQIGIFGNGAMTASSTTTFDWFRKVA